MTELPNNPLPSEQDFPKVVPILPLQDLVIFPSMVAPLLVTVSSSTQLIDKVVSGNRFIGLIAQKNTEVENPTKEDLYKTGCLGRVLKMLKFPDDSMRVLVQGLRRMKVTDYDQDNPYLIARIDVLEDKTGNSAELIALMRHASKEFQKIIDVSPNLPDELKMSASNLEDPSKLADLIAANLNISLVEKQMLLETTDVGHRFGLLTEALEKELNVLQLGSEIQNRVSTALSKTQREYFLREQLKQIQKELGESEGTTGDVTELKKRLEEGSLSEDAAKVARKEIERIEIMPPSSAEYTVSRSYLDWLLGMPWGIYTDDNLDLKRARKILDEDHYDMEAIKERIVEFLAVLKLKKDKHAPIICFVGPPGVGKTSLGKSIARALGRKFVRFSLGGLRDEAEIRGHRRTYVGALPGRIIQAVRRAGSSNPVVMLDEIDKVGKDFRGDPSAALLEVLDPEQNSDFSDHYLEVSFDLSRVMFITTANWLDPIPPALRDRMEVLELRGYTELEKLQIATQFLLPQQRAEHGLKAKQFNVPKAAIQKIISSYTREAGVRNLEREIANLCRKVARMIVEGRRTHVNVTPKDLPKLLGHEKFEFEVAERTAVAGVATALAWTPEGGEILFVEASRMPGKGTLQLTGSLGEVMRESAQAALSYLRSHASDLKIPERYFFKNDIHVHVPAGGTPKDGPSAGVAMAAAMASITLGKKVRADVAMTGEISLRGKVLPVGGIKEKVMAAARAGIRTVLLPQKNLVDLDDIPSEVRKKLKFIPLNTVEDVYKNAISGKQIVIEE